MNLSRLEGMVNSGDMSKDAFEYLLHCRSECEWLDYKESLKIEDDYSLCCFARDVVGMKNVGGGYLLVGVRDKTWEIIGLDSRLPYDTKMLRDKVFRATGLYIEVDIVQHQIYLTGAMKYFPLILVRASKKRSKRRVPSLVSKDCCCNKPFGLRRGEIYARKGDSTVKISSSDELLELLDDLESHSDEDAVRPEEIPSPFAIEDGTYKLLDKGFERLVGRVDVRDKLLAAIDKDPRIWIINVHGPGGVGKSAIVNWAAYEFYNKKSFEMILQLTAKETILTDTGIKKHSKCLYSLENLLDHVLQLFGESTEADLEAKRKTVIDYLCAWKSLLILDNMETVSDGRILTFIQQLPVESKTKVILTSRQKTGGWELPIYVKEMERGEIKEFIEYKANEMGVDFPLDDLSIKSVIDSSGGLPLATQWIIGQYKRTKNLPNVLSLAGSKDSPILEFSFRNIWNILSSESRTILAVLSVFDGPATLQQMVLASGMSAEFVERAISDLLEVTLINKSTQQSDGRTLYGALPITLDFARNELANMGTLELQARRKIQAFNEQMELQASETYKFQADFEKFGITTDNEKRAAILAKRAESEMFSGNTLSAEMLFKQAYDYAPNSAFIISKFAIFELNRNKIHSATDKIKEACQRCNKKNGAFCYSVLARIMDAQRNHLGKIDALVKALEYDPENTILRHQYGVALSRSGKTREAVDQFTAIIDKERKLTPPRETLVMALTTRILNLERLHESDKIRDDISFAKKLIQEYPYLRSSYRLEETIEKYS
jgi:hypothetical protein